MRLIVTNPALDEALKAQGKDWRTFTRQEMRTVVCANCHVEYYFKGDGKYLTFPWEKARASSRSMPITRTIGFSDWKHNDSQAPMIKMQHPEYEFFTAGSTHYAAGVSCADCHMPYTRDGAVKFSTHDVHCPLLDPASSCGACHTDVDYVTGRVAEIQKQVADTMIATEDALVQAIERDQGGGRQYRRGRQTAGRSAPAAPLGPAALGFHRRREQHGLPQPRRSAAHPGRRHRPGPPGAVESRAGGSKIN